MNSKKCVTCKQILPLVDFYPHRRMKDGKQSACKKCSRQWHRDRPDYIRKKNAEFKRRFPTYHRDWQRKSKYGATIIQLVNALRLKQNGLCAGCFSDLSTSKECVDHDHKTGKIRGLLCNNCNTSLGKLKDSPEILRRLAAYVEEGSR